MCGGVDVQCEGRGEDDEGVTGRGEGTIEAKFAWNALEE